MLDSVRARLTLWYTGVLALVLLIFAAATYGFLSRLATERTDNSLVESANAFASFINNERADEVFSPTDSAVSEALREFHFTDRTFTVYDKTHRLIASSDTVTNSRPKLRGPASATALPPNLLGEVQRSGNAYVTLPEAKEDTGDIRVYGRLTKVNGREFIIVVLRSLQDQDEMLEQLRTALYIAIPLSLLVASLGGYFLARKSLAPVVMMGNKAARIGAANLHERLPVANERDELGRLARVFNDLLARLNDSFEQQRRFMADASHELRTPVAVVRGESEVVLSQTDRTPEDYRESLAIVHDEGRRLTRIVEDLFMLARADAGQYQVRLSDFYLDEVVGESVRALRSLAAQRRVEMRYETSGELPLRADEALIRRMVVNLLDNAIKYTPANGTVDVTCVRRGSQYLLTVADTGIGIPSEAQPHVFERFYRADKARSSAEVMGDHDPGSGAGLGLAIARWIAEVHHGQLELIRSDETGSVFVVSLPVTDHNSKSPPKDSSN